MSEKMLKVIDDIGIAAYILMHGHQCKYKNGKKIYFEINKEDEAEFDKLSFEYLSSPFYSFDSNIMILRKINSSYMPPD